MHLKTLLKSGRIILKAYPDNEYRDILIEKNSYVLRQIHSHGVDYGGSHCTDAHDVTYGEIIPERILVKNGHFCGVCIYTEFDCTNGDFRNHTEEVILLVDGTGAQYARSGTDFSNDDHSRWDYVDYYLVSRDNADGNG